jgi:hypothetical protein
MAEEFKMADKPKKMLVDSDFFFLDKKYDHQQLHRGLPSSRAEPSVFDIKVHSSIKRQPRFKTITVR